MPWQISYMYRIHTSQGCKSHTEHIRHKVANPIPNTLDRSTSTRPLHLEGTVNVKETPPITLGL